DRSAKQDARSGAGKAHKNQSCDNCEPDRPKKDFYCDNHMAVESRWIHMAVADSGECFDTEEERLRKRSRGHLADAGAPEQVKQRKQQVDQQIGADEEQSESRPGE